jgi:hypothetical protein
MMEVGCALKTTTTANNSQAAPPVLLPRHALWAHQGCPGQQCSGCVENACYNLVERWDMGSYN